MRRLLLWGSLLAWLTPAVAQAQNFSGEFSEVRSDSELCRSLFEPKEYNGIHRRLNTPGRQSVWSFRRDDDQGFFHGAVMVSLYGPNGDVYFEDDLIESETGDRVEFVAEGFIAPNVVVLDFMLKRYLGESDTERCQASATFSAFE